MYFVSTTTNTTPDRIHTGASWWLARVVIQHELCNEFRTASEAASLDESERPCLRVFGGLTDHQHIFYRRFQGRQILTGQLPLLLVDYNSNLGNFCGTRTGLWTVGSAYVGASHRISSCHSFHRELACRTLGMETKRPKHWVHGNWYSCEYAQLCLRNKKVVLCITARIPSCWREYSFGLPGGLRRLSFPKTILIPLSTINITPICGSKGQPIFTLVGVWFHVHS